MTWIYSLIPSWMPGWLVEAISGVITTVFCVVIDRLIFTARRLTFIFIAANILSIIYEIFLDPNHWNLTDFAQREVGIIVVIVTYKIYSYYRKSSS